jgi:sulfate adenylyltransferase subunit 1 (EFTu-like GTPase family)
LVSIVHRLDPADLRAVPATSLAGNDLGRVRIVLDEPIVADRYADHRQTGHFVLIDPASNLTIAAGMIEEFA